MSDITTPNVEKFTDHLTEGTMGGELEIDQSVKHDIQGKNCYFKPDSQQYIIEDAYNPDIPYKIPIEERDPTHILIGIVVGLLLLLMLCSIYCFLYNLNSIFKDLDDDFERDDEENENFEMWNQGPMARFQA